MLTLLSSLHVILSLNYIIYTHYIMMLGNRCIIAHYKYYSFYRIGVSSTTSSVIQYNRWVTINNTAIILTTFVLTIPLTRNSNTYSTHVTMQKDLANSTYSGGPLSTTSRRKKKRETKLAFISRTYPAFVPSPHLTTPGTRDAVPHYFNQRRRRARSPERRRIMHGIERGERGWQSPGEMGEGWTIPDRKDRLVEEGSSHRIV